MTGTGAWEEEQAARGGCRGLDWAGADPPHAATPADGGPSSPAFSRAGLPLPLLCFEKLKFPPKFISNTCSGLAALENQESLVAQC